QIVDISPLAGLIGLRDLRMKSNEVMDISPLSGLVNLRYLELHVNQISDISPLQGLVNLEVLNLAGNPITNFTPLYGLSKVTVAIGGLPIDFETLQRLKLDPADRIICNIERAPILPRIENIQYPAIFQACGPIVNRPELSLAEQLGFDDLFFCGIPGMHWIQAPNDSLVLTLGEVRMRFEKGRARNPNILLLASIEFYGASRESPYALRDESGNVIIDEKWQGAFADFRHPDIQNRFIQQAREIAKCGLFDGIAIDHWGKTGLGDITLEETVAAKDRMIQAIRDGVDDDFLILVTVSNNIIPTRHHAEYINGFFMETTENYEGGYTHARLARIENTLSWAEENLREPQINCLAGRGVRNELLDSPRNLQWMRLWTTMSLTHSDGYVVFTRGAHLLHPPHPWEFVPGHADAHAQGVPHSHQNQNYWYDFWDADLGRPVGGDETKAQLYENREGLFIREFTNGWAVYNRSGTAQEIELPQEVSGWSSGVKDKRRHTLADLDGEIYLKAETAPTVDVNGDGIVNIQDLVIVANAFGEAAPDLNGDGVVNIQDLVIVANAF
ncbi:MAG: leucine-rich repeat domain-containing protein, partial [Candidatus Poribacteria bacterium]|nr:leucine-rich repeat domain-containing protein [Candidatus Poribacteria bacterium]